MVDAFVADLPVLGVAEGVRLRGHERDGERLDHRAPQIGTRRGEVLLRESVPPRAEGAKAWQWAAAPKDGFHVLWHTYASIMLEAGESVVTLARWLGHSSPAITLGYYAHFMPEAGSKGRGTIDGLLGERGDRLAGRNSPDSPQRR